MGMKTKTVTILISWIILLLGGCGTTYIPPGAKANLQAFAPTGIQDAFAAVPTNPFPASIALVRVQGPSYHNYYLSQQGGAVPGARYTVVTAREIEEERHLERLRQLDQVAGIVALNRMLLPPDLNSEQQIREAAARLQADLIILYTFDTVFFDHDRATTLSVITLGLAPTRKITATTTVSALLLDTRTGYVYSAYEASHRESVTSTSWASGDAADSTRRNTEKVAFDAIVEQFVQSWPTLLAKHLNLSNSP